MLSLTSSDFKLIKRYKRVIPTSSNKLNEILDGGLETGNLIVVQAPSGAGKSTFLMRMCYECLHQTECAFISAGEQDLEEIVSRFAAIHAGIKWIEFRKLSFEEKEKYINDFNKEFEGRLHIYISEMPFDMNEKLVNDDIISYCDMDLIKEDIDNKAIKYVFFDYLNACIAHDANSTHYYYTQIASDLKLWANNKSIMIMTAMQTNRTLKGYLSSKEFDPHCVDEFFMGESVGPARKATICLSLFKKGEKTYLNVFKNRPTGKLNAWEITFSDNYRIIDSSVDEDDWRMSLK